MLAVSGTGQGAMMRAIAFTAAAAGLLALCGCGLPGASGGAAADAPAKAVANDTAQNGLAAAPALGGKDVPGTVQALSASGAPPAGSAFLIGGWTDDGDCDNAGEFDADGRFSTAAGEQGLWILDGDRLTMTFNGETRMLRIVPIDRDTMNVVNPDGSLGRSTRC